MFHLAAFAFRGSPLLNPRKGNLMKVYFLDLATGRKAQSTGVSEFSLTESSWSCDCNRAIPFDELSDSRTCDGCSRYIVIGVEAESDEEQFDEDEVIKEANSGYFQRL